MRNKLSRDATGKAVKKPAPATFGIEHTAQLLGGRAEIFELAVLEVHARLALGHRDETDVHLGQKVGIAIATAH